MRNKFFTKMFALTSGIVKGIPLVFLGLFAMCIFFKSQLIVSPVSLLCLLMITCILFVSKFKTEKWGIWLLVIFFVAFIARILFLKIWPITPLSDCEMAYNFSLQLNNTSIFKWHEAFASNSYYYEVWPMHVPFVIFQTICIKFFGSSIFSIQIVNMFFSALTCVFTAVCAEGLSKNRRIGIIAGLFMAFNVTTLFMAAFLVNQHVSTCFFMASMCFIFKKPFKLDWLNYITSGALLAIGHLMRPEMYIVLIAVLCMFVFEILKNKSVNTKLRSEFVFSIIAKCLCFVLVFLLLINIANALLLGLRWVDAPITESKLQYKLMVGLNQETEGRFKDSGYPLAANELAVNEVLKERIAGPIDTVKLMIKKLCFQFSSYNYWWLQADKGGELRQAVINNIFEPITQGYMFLIICFAFIVSIKKFKNKDKRMALLYIIYIGFLCAFALMEVQQRYAYITVPIVTILAALLFEKNTTKEKE